MRLDKNRMRSAVKGAVFIVCLLAGAASSWATLPVAGQQQEPIPFNRLGAEIDKQYGGQTPQPVATRSGYRLVSKMQALEAEVSDRGLTITSLAKREGSGSFSIVPVAVNGVKAQAGTLPSSQPAADATVMLDRGRISERFSASADGIRQDFIIAQAPSQKAYTSGLTSELVLTLSVNGATASRHEKKPNAALLTLPAGRKLVYDRLHVIDVDGRELPARISIPTGAGNKELKIIVATCNAKYPITIDPTITDADWEIMNPGIPGMDNNVYALALDGSGNLYAGGWFHIAGSVAANHIAKWDGTGWSALGSGMSSSVSALAMDGSGNLYAGGTFTTAGGVAANYIAKWDGTGWSALGSGLGSSVSALAMDGSGNLYAGGAFTTAGGEAANYIAKWDGTSWSALGSGLGSSVSALAMDGSGNLYAGGAFTTAGGVAANYIAKWDSTSWSALGSGMGSSVSALAIDGSGNLYAGGGFTTAGGVAANRIAKWNGTGWSALGSGLGSSVSALAMDGSGNLYAGGSFTTAGGVAANRIAKWNGTSWSALGSGMKS